MEVNQKPRNKSLPLAQANHLNSLCACLFITFVGALALGLVTLTQYSLYDSIWTNYFLKSSGQLWCLERILSEIGRPLDFFFLYPLHFVANPVICSKWISVVAWIAAAICFQRFLRNGLLLSSVDATLIASIGLSLPFFDLIGELCVLMNATATLLFWLGWLLVLKIRRACFTKSLSGGLRLLAWLMFALAFNLNSHLVYFYGVAFAVILCSAEPIGFKGITAAVFKDVKSFPDFAVLPVAFWIWKLIFCPLGGLYAEWKYNEISLDPSNIASGMLSLVSTFLSELCEAAQPPERLLIPVAVGAFIVLIIHLKPKWLPDYHDMRPWDCIFHIGIGLLLLASASLPYFITKKNFDSSGWDTRNAVLIHFPTAIILYFLIRLLQRTLLTRYHRSIYAVVGFVIASGIISWNVSALRLEALGAKQESITQKIRQGLHTRSPYAISLRDYFQIPMTIAYYPHIVWTYMATEINEYPKVLIVDTRPYAQDQVSQTGDGKPNITVPLLNFNSDTYARLVKQTTMDYALTSLPKEGNTQTIIITPGKLGNQGEAIGLSFLYRQYFLPKERQSFLKDLSTVTFVEDNGSQQTN